MADKGEKPEGEAKMKTGGAILANLIEATNLSITGHKLNGHNYTQWARSIRLFLQGKRKEEYNICSPVV